MANAASADREIGEVFETSEIKANYKNRLLASTTKVVRIFVIGEKSDVDEAFIAEKSPTRSDVFTIKPATPTDGGVLEPWTWLGEPDGLVEHHIAHDKHRGTVPVLLGKYRDQIEWQCDVDFKVSKITPTTHHHFDNHDGLPYPFEKKWSQLSLETGGANKPVRSGPTQIVWIDLPLLPSFPKKWKQLYKATFELKIDGKTMILDPDFYCEWH